MGVQKNTVAKSVHGAKGGGSSREVGCGREDAPPAFLQTWCLLFPVRGLIALGRAPTLSSGICNPIWPLSAPQMVFF